MIYLHFKDLSDDKQYELIQLAREEIRSEYKQERWQKLTVYEQATEEKIDQKLQTWSHEWKFIFNI